jgi:hypothetical protein
VAQGVGPEFKTSTAKKKRPTGRDLFPSQEYRIQFYPWIENQSHVSSLIEKMSLT